MPSPLVARSVAWMLILLVPCGCASPVPARHEKPPSPEGAPNLGGLAIVSEEKLRQLLALGGVTATASSSLAGFGPGRAVDGNVATEWSSGDYKGAEASLTLDTGAVRNVSSLRLKTKPQGGGAFFRIEISADGVSFTPVSANVKNTSWNLETKVLPTDTRGRYVRIHFFNDAVRTEIRFSVFEAQLDGTAIGPSAGPSSTPPPSSAPSTTPTVSPAGTAVPIIPVANPGPFAARGRVTLAGQPGPGLRIELLRLGGGSQFLTTDAQGYFLAKGLAAGDYQAHFYNDSDRNKVGYWRSRALRADATTGAAFPRVDLFQVGVTNTPAVNSRIRLPRTFIWVRQVQPARISWFRVHSNAGRSFALVYKSPDLAGDATTFTWSGGVPLSSTNKYYWGFKWDAGPVGEGGCLYQAIYFDP